MEEIKVENELKLAEAKKGNLRKTMEMIKSQANDILILNLQWNDLENHLQLTEERVEKRFVELVLKEEELQNTSFALEERVKVVEAAEAELGDFECKADGFKREIEEKSEELGLMRKSLEECTVEQMLKAGQLNEMVGLLSKTQVDLDMKAEQLRQVETDLERHRRQLIAEVEHLDLTQTRRRELDEEIERKTKDVTLVLDKIAECENLFEARSSELLKTQGEVELKGIQLEQMNIDLERHRGEVREEMEHLDRSRTCNKELEDEIERKRSDLTAVLDKLSECGKQLDSQQKLHETSSLELVSKEKELVGLNLDLDLKEYRVSSLNDDMESKAKELQEIERLIKERSAYIESIEMLFEEHTEELASKEKRHNEITEAIRKLSLELVSKEKELAGLNLDLNLREHRACSLNDEMESKAKELEDIEKLIKERSAYNESIKMLFEEHTEEHASKEKRHREITEAIHKLSLEVDDKKKTLERAKVFIQQLSEKQHSKQKKLESTERHLQRSTADYDSKKKELRSVKDTIRESLEKLEIKERELKSLQSLITERYKQVEEGEKKKQHLDNSIEELISQLQVKQEEVCSINKTIRECSDELEFKRKHLDQVQSSITDLTAELKSKECDLDSVKKKICDSLKDFQSKEEQQVILQASLREREEELGLKERQSDARSEKIELKEKELDAREEKLDEKDQQLKSTEQKLAEIVKDIELKAKKLSSFCQQSNQDQHVDLVQDTNVCDEKTLQLILHGHLKKCHQLHLDFSRALKASSDPAKLVLDTIEGRHQRMEVTKGDSISFRRTSICLLECLMDMSPEPTTELQEKAIKSATEWKNTTLVKAENPVEVLGFLHFLAAFSLAYTFDADKVQNLFDVAFLCQYAPSLCEALGVSSLAPVNNVLSLNDMPEQQPREALISRRSDSRCRDVQENIASSHLANEDVLTDIEGSAYFLPNEVFTGLQVMNDPGRYVLNSVSDALMGAQQRGELRLAEPMVKNLVSLLEELPRVVSSSKHLLSDALKVITRWSWMMRTSGQMSPLEAWAFLQFIVAYGLVHQTDRDSTLRFAWAVVCLKQAPKLYESLGLGYAIPELVRQLLKERHHIPAIRFILFFKLNYNVSPLEFLKEEISILRRSAKEKRRFDSQAEDRDAGRLRDIIELIEDFKLEIDLPVELIIKFMVPRDIQNQKQYVVSSFVPVQPPQVHMQASHTVIQSSYIATRGSNMTFPTSLGSSPNQQVLDLETYQAGGSKATEAQSSHQTGFKRPRMDPSVIRPCFNPSGYGKF